MAVKRRYCPHEPKARIYRRSRSSRVICCETCYFHFVGLEIKEAQGEEFLIILDRINDFNFSKAFPVYIYEPFK